MNPADALFLLGLTALALAAATCPRRAKGMPMPQAVRLRDAGTPIDDLEPGDAVCDQRGTWTVCDPGGNLTRLEGKVLGVLMADGLSASGPVWPGTGRTPWLLQAGLWVEVESA